MSQQYDNTNRGVLFTNDRKETDKHPDLSGSLNIDGVEHWFSGWWKHSDSKGDFLSLSIGKPKDNHPQQRQQRQDPERRGARPGQASRPPPQQRQQRPPPPDYYEDDPGSYR